jgi:hypothetical protein
MRFIMDRPFVTVATVETDGRQYLEINVAHETVRVSTRFVRALVEGLKVDRAARKALQLELGLSDYE